MKLIRKFLCLSILFSILLLPPILRADEAYGNRFTNITTATTTTVKSGSGVLYRVIVNTTAAGTITIYDNTSAAGTKMGTMKASIVEQSFEFGHQFNTGLTIVTGAASDITVVYR